MIKVFLRSFPTYPEFFLHKYINYKNRYGGLSIW